MDILELLKQLGVDIGEDKADAIKSAFGEALEAEIRPLKSTIEAIRDDKAKLKDNVAKAEQEKAAEAEKAAKAAGQIEEFERLATERHANEMKDAMSKLEALQEKLSTKDSLILGKAKAETIAKLSNKFKVPESGALLLESMVSTGFNEAGEVINTFTGFDKANIEGGIDGFTKYMQESPAMTTFLKAVESSGGGSNGSKSSSGASGGKSNIEILYGN